MSHLELVVFDQDSPYVAVTMTLIVFRLKASGTEKEKEKEKEKDKKHAISPATTPLKVSCHLFAFLYLRLD